MIDETFEPELSRFVDAMRYKLRKHELDRGESWKQERWDILSGLLHELVEGLKENASPYEFADVANFAFFAWYRLSQGGML